MVILGIRYQIHQEVHSSPHQLPLHQQQHRGQAIHEDHIWDFHHEHSMIQYKH